MHTIEIKPNDYDALEKAFAENNGDVAAIIAEPTGGHAGTFPTIPDWNKTMRKICDENGALLIF
jgi:glutamate-1-semialdehyde 2,1-aminomutase